MSFTIHPRFRDTLAKLASLREQFPFEPRNPETYAKAKSDNRDSYGTRIYDFAEDWAALMESQLSEGASLSDIAEKTCHIADYDGITGFMYGCAVSILVTQWKHGEELRVWHNTQYDVDSTTEGTVNPAIMKGKGQLS
jgi:hypothetical protein